MDVVHVSADPVAQSCLRRLVRKMARSRMTDRRACSPRACFARACFARACSPRACSPRACFARACSTPTLWRRRGKSAGCWADVVMLWVSWSARCGVVGVGLGGGRGAWAQRHCQTLMESCSHEKHCNRSAHRENAPHPGQRDCPIASPFCRPDARRLTVPDSIRRSVDQSASGRLRRPQRNTVGCATRDRGSALCGKQLRGHRTGRAVSSRCAGTGHRASRRAHSYFGKSAEFRFCGYAPHGEDARTASSPQRH